MRFKSLSKKVYPQDSGTFGLLCALVGMCAGFGLAFAGGLAAIRLQAPWPQAMHTSTEQIIIGGAYVALVVWTTLLGASVGAHLGTSIDRAIRRAHRAAVAAARRTANTARSHAKRGVERTTARVNRARDSIKRAPGEIRGIIERRSIEPLPPPASDAR